MATDTEGADRRKSIDFTAVSSRLKRGYGIKRMTNMESSSLQQSIDMIQRNIRQELSNMDSKQKKFGHLFSTEADISKIACDAWLLPTDEQKNVLPLWTDGHKDDILAELSNKDYSSFVFPEDWSRSWNRAAAPKTWKKSNGPMPILTITRSECCEEQDTLEWRVDAIRHFVDAWIANPLRHLPSRARPLLAVPLVGTGEGGEIDHSTILLLNLLAANCEDIAINYNIDIVVTIRNPKLFALFQYLRRQADTAWPTLQGKRLSVAKELASKARNGEMVLFLGAGVSMGGGLPSWGKLLDMLCKTAEIPPEKKKLLQNLDFYDYAQILKEDLQSKGLDINTEIAKIIKSKTYSLTHALLACWNVANAVTQNYDDMYEQATADSSGKNVAVIPYKIDSGSERWLLKMHGCVHWPKDIVLTREDYHNYEIHRQALSGVVQTLMITKHMLILGFSMTDDHFNDLAFTLRKAVEGMERNETLGTVITLLPDVVRSQLWRDDLSFFSACADENASFSEAARDLEIFLDYIGAFANNSMDFLFDTQMDPLLDDQSISLRDGLKKLMKDICKDDNSPVIEDFLGVLANRYGYHEDMESDASDQE